MEWWAASKAPSALRFAGAVHTHHPFAFGGKDAVSASPLLCLLLIRDAGTASLPWSGGIWILVPGSLLAFRRARARKEAIPDGSTRQS